jgi:hypothetical protein
MRIVVFLDSNYQENDEFECPDNWNKEEITEEVNCRYPYWYSYDIWEED